MISQFESFLCPDKQGTRCGSTYNSKDEDNISKKSQPK